MLLAMLTLLMVQVRSFFKLLLVFLTAPLGAIAAGAAPLEAIVESTVRRTRPVVLTALAAILAMLPLTRSVLWGPMALSIMGGLIVATVLTLFFLPALYAAWFRVLESRHAEAGGPVLHPEFPRLRLAGK